MCGLLHADFYSYSDDFSAYGGLIWLCGMDMIGVGDVNSQDYDRDYHIGGLGPHWCWNKAVPK